MSGIIERDRKEYFKEYHEKNKDKRNALSAIRREAKRDEINEEKRNYYYETILKLTYVLYYFFLFI